MPDVILFDEEKNWLFLVNAVTPVGPMNPKRIIELGDLTKNVTAGKIFVTAFLDFATYKKFAADLVWDTEVEIAKIPEHMIHLNGDKFLGPRGGSARSHNHSHSRSCKRSTLIFLLLRPIASSKLLFLFLIWMTLNPII